MAGRSSSISGCKRQLLIQIPLLLFSVFVFLPLTECRYATISNLVQPLNGLRLDLVHKDSLLFPNSTLQERVKRAVQNSQKRFEKLQIVSAVNTDQLQAGDQLKDLESPVTPGNGEFLIETAVGTPASSFSAILDTGSDLVWTRCRPCNNCSSKVYNPSASSTYSKVTCDSTLCPLANLAEQFSCSKKGECDYTYKYSDKSLTKGIVSYETFAFSSQSFPHVAFGCSHETEGFDTQLLEDGLVGFGRGALSLVSQLGPSLGNKFSYCLVSLSDSPSTSSPLFVGQTPTLKANNVSSTPIIPSRLNPSFYYLSLEGISVGGKLLAIPTGTFDLQPEGSGGVIIDSGTTLTYLPKTAYEALTKALKSSVRLPPGDGSSIGLDLCFTTSNDTSRFPSLTFHFKGADFELTSKNYLMNVSDNKSGGRVSCLAMIPGNNSDTSIFGVIAQQNFQILYDNENNILSFAPTACDRL